MSFPLYCAGDLWGTGGCRLAAGDKQIDFRLASRLARFSAFRAARDSSVMPLIFTKE
jgi:hypothetical protein